MAGVRGSLDVFRGALHHHLRAGNAQTLPNRQTDEPRHDRRAAGRRVDAYRASADTINLFTPKGQHAPPHSHEIVM